MCYLRTRSNRVPLDMNFNFNLNFVLIGYCIGLWCIFIYTHYARRKRLNALYKKYKEDLVKSDEELGMIKD